MDHLPLSPERIGCSSSRGWLMRMFTFPTQINLSKLSSRRANLTSFRYVWYIVLDLWHWYMHSNGTKECLASVEVLGWQKSVFCQQMFDFMKFYYPNASWLAKMQKGLNFRVHINMAAYATCKQLAHFFMPIVLVCSSDSYIYDSVRHTCYLVAKIPTKASSHHCAKST